MVRLANVSVKSVTLWSLLSVIGIAALITGLFFFLPTQKRTTILPEVRLESLSGNPVNLSSLEGNPVVLNLWATWCGPCRRELPLFVEMKKAHPDVTFLFVNQKESLKQIEAFLQEENLTLKHVLLDARGQLTQHFNVFGLPSTLFFDSQGNLVNTQIGEVSSVQLFNMLTELTRP